MISAYSFDFIFHLIFGFEYKITDGYMAGLITKTTKEKKRSRKEATLIDLEEKQGVVFRKFSNSSLVLKILSVFILPGQARELFA